MPFDWLYQKVVYQYQISFEQYYQRRLATVTWLKVIILVKNTSTLRAPKYRAKFVTVRAYFYSPNSQITLFSGELSSYKDRFWTSLIHIKFTGKKALIFRYFGLVFPQSNLKFYNNILSYSIISTSQYFKTYLKADILMKFKFGT